MKLRAYICALHAALLAVLLAVSPAGSGPLTLLGAGKAGAGGGGGSPTFTATANPAIQSRGFGASPTTFSAASIGTATADRIVVVGIGSSSGAAVTGVTIDSGGGAVAMTSAAATTNSGNLNSYLYYLAVASGATATIVVSTSASVEFMGISVGIMTGITGPSGTAQVENSNFGGDPHNLTVTVPSSGFGIYFGCSLTPNASPTANNITADYTNQILGGTQFQLLFGHNSTPGSQAIGFSLGNFGGYSAAARAWTP